jgi:hypothetical protein
MASSRSSAVKGPAMALAQMGIGTWTTWTMSIAEHPGAMMEMKHMRILMIRSREVGPCRSLTSCEVGFSFGTLTAFRLGHMLAPPQG